MNSLPRRAVLWGAVIVVIASVLVALTVVSDPGALAPDRRSASAAMPADGGSVSSSEPAKMQVPAGVATVVEPTQYGDR